MLQISYFPNKENKKQNGIDIFDPKNIIFNI